jgi:pimeloyl-ACP methyl ester carboxylesterase
MTAASPLPLALSGQLFKIPSPLGPIAVYTAGHGPAVLLIHSVNAAASAAEVRPLFDRLQQRYTVYALDLPGYGQSERRPIAYTVRIMTDALHLVSQWIRARHQHQALDALAVSLATEFLARAALEQPADYARLCLVSPTGLRGTRPWRGPIGSTRFVPWLDKAFRGPGWGGFLFRQLTRPGVIRYFLERTWGSKDIDETLWAYCVATTRAPHAEFAPLSFLSAGLFSADIHTIYEGIRQPALIIHGSRGDFTDYRGLKVINTGHRWQVHALETGALPYFEQPDVFMARLEEFFFN